MLDGCRPGMQSAACSAGSSKHHPGSWRSLWSCTLHDAAVLRTLCHLFNDYECYRCVFLYNDLLRFGF